MEGGLLMKSNFFFALKKSVTELCLSCELTCPLLPGVPSFLESFDPLLISSLFFPSSTSLFLVDEGGVRRGEEEERGGVLQFCS